MSALGKASNDKAALWLYRRGPTGPPETATLILPDTLGAGRYRLHWWNPYTGKPISESVVSVKAKMSVVVTTPPIERDVALWVEKAK